MSSLFLCSLRNQLHYLFTDEIKLLFKKGPIMIVIRFRDDWGKPAPAAVPQSTVRRGMPRHAAVSFRCREATRLQIIYATFAPQTVESERTRFAFRDTQHGIRAQSRFVHSCQTWISFKH